MTVISDHVFVMSPRLTMLHLTYLDLGIARIVVLEVMGTNKAPNSYKALMPLAKGLTT